MEEPLETFISLQIFKVLLVAKFILGVFIRILKLASGLWLHNLHIDDKSMRQNCSHMPNRRTEIAAMAHRCKPYGID
jgi:hypothetical protein